MSIVCRPPTAEYSTSRSARTVSGITDGAGVWPAMTPEDASKRIEIRERIDATIFQSECDSQIFIYPVSMRLRPATLEDLTFLGQLERRFCELGCVGSDCPDEHRDRMADPDCRYYLVEENGQPA